jgi:soluble lytic murein transglycosylase
MTSFKTFVIHFFVFFTLCPPIIAEEYLVPNRKPEPSIIIYEQKSKIIPSQSLNRSKDAKPLTNRDIALYSEVYRLQRDLKWQEADTIIQKIDNSILIGHVLAYRYMHSNFEPSNLMIERWLELYNDHPQAKTLAKKIKMDGVTYRKRINGTINELRYFSHGSKYISANYNSKQRYEIQLLRKKITKYLEDGYATQALKSLNNHPSKRYIDPIDESQILSQIASVYLYLGYNDKARNTAKKAVALSTETPVAPWIMGLISWMNKDYPNAAKNFTLAANATYASPWMTSAAAYWGARASMRARQYQNVSSLLSKAMQNQRTFYGLIATRALGYGFDFNWTMPEFTPKLQDVLQQYQAGARAQALAKIGQLDLAEAELFSLPVKDNPSLGEAAIALANQYNLAGYAMRFSMAVKNPAGGYYDGGLFPISSWTQNKSHSTNDAALTNGFIRQESRFDIKASNATGATGLMQIMPNTAAFITNNGLYKTKEGRDLLFNPTNNITIGQNYLDHLKNLEVIDHNLFSLAIAYNAGPGNLRKWQKNLQVKDPLLFIELIPSSETRAFVERVVTNYWIYQMQQNADTKTLTAVAAGEWPILDKIN